MGRKYEDIKESFTKTYEDLDGSLEVETGPVQDTIIAPISQELSETEEVLTKVEGLHSTEFIFNADQEDIDAYITNFAMEEGGGVTSKGHAYFIRLIPLVAGEVIEIPKDVIVSNLAADLFYKTTETVIMDGDKASTYYNAVSSWYEIKVPIEATIFGDEHDLPKFRIKMSTTILGIDKVINKDKIRGGLDVETKERQYDRVTNAFSGLDNGSQGGVIKTVENYNPRAIESVTLIRSIDEEFTRNTTKNALDIFIDGKEEETVTVPFVVTEPTLKLLLTQTPVISVDALTIDGVALTTGFILEKKEDGNENSIREESIISLSNELLVGSTGEITYTYNKLIQDVQADLFSSGEELCDFDPLARTPFYRNVYLGMTIFISSSANEAQTLTDIQSVLNEQINLSKSRRLIYKDIATEVRNNVPNVTNLIWTKFTSDGGFLDIENVEMPKHTLPILLEENALIKVG